RARRLAEGLEEVTQAEVERAPGDVGQPVVQEVRGVGGRAQSVGRNGREIPAVVQIKNFSAQLQTLLLAESLDVLHDCQIAVDRVRRALGVCTERAEDTRVGRVDNVLRVRVNRNARRT